MLWSMMYSIIQPTMNKGYMQFTLSTFTITSLCGAILCQQVAMHVIKTMRAVLGRQYTDTAVCHFVACELRLLDSTQEVCSLAKPLAW